MGKHLPKNVEKLEKMQRENLKIDRAKVEKRKEHESETNQEQSAS
jgi:hypothetical protein